MRDELLGYYERELVFLRRMGAEFARKYPKVAARLQLDEEKIEDPHVERMVEAFAFLAARIQLKLDDELPEVTESFLNVLYPHYLAPLPSMAIAGFTYGSPRDKLTAVQRIERGARLASRPVDGTPCRFRTCYPVDLAPLELESAALESPAPTDARGRWSTATLRLSLRGFGGSALHEMKSGETGEPLRSLRFYLDGEPQLVFPLYEMIFNQATAVELREGTTKINPNISMMTQGMMSLKPAAPVVMPPTALKQVGFAPDEGILPYSPKSFLGYRLLTEYFAFPYKFLFFEVTGIDEAVRNKFNSRIDILIHLRDVAPPRSGVTRDTFRLNCTPIVNLFEQSADPIYISGQKYEYQIVPDVHRQNKTEIYSVDAVTSVDPRTGNIKNYQPFYGMRHAYGEQYERAFWYAGRRLSNREDDDGTEVFLSFVDSAFNPRAPATEVLNVHTTCTNRDLPARLPFGGREGDFEIEGATLLSRVRCLTKPTETVRPPLRRRAQWRLISHLNLNHLSLVNNADGSPEALQEMLHLYDFADSSVVRKQILGITSVTSRQTVRQLGSRTGTGFVRGVETTIEFDETEFVGAGLFVFACVLEKFLGLYVSLNSFNQLVMRTKQREGIVRRFAPRAGEQTLL